jgi:23S rRNA (guanosine2251-2'-O)-methyltransferase
VTRQPRGRPSRTGKPARPRAPEARSGIGGEQVEGRQAVLALLRARRRAVHQVLVAEGSDQAWAVTEILDLARAAGVPVRRVTREQIDAVALTDSPQGVVAKADPVQEKDLADLIGQRAGTGRPFLVVLDGVTDPHNLGAVMRSALCAGATGLVLGRHRSARLTPAAVKAAAGAVEHLPVATVAGIPASLSNLSDAGIWTVGLDTGARSPLWGLRVATEPVALVLGAEGSGLSRLVRERCDLTVDIPLAGPIESLNVSVAAGLACFEVARVRGAEPSV